MRQTHSGVRSQTDPTAQEISLRSTIEPSDTPQNEARSSRPPPPQLLRREGGEQGLGTHQEKSSG